MPLFGIGSSEKNLGSCVEISGDLYNQNRLFASQIWTSGGTESKGDPSVYPFRFRKKECYLVGDGHHRVANAIMNGRKILCVKDIFLGDFDEKMIKNWDYALQKLKLGKYGIEGMWPFSMFLTKLLQDPNISLIDLQDY